ncbi:MAG: YdbL family protein [Steroidobacteraceae bacterium]
MKRIIPFKLMILGLLAACVTVNVYFPAAAAEQAADRIIDTVTSQPGGTKPNSDTNETAPKKTPPNSRLTPKPDGLMRDVPGADRLARVAPAQAAHADAGLAHVGPAADRPLLLAAAGALLNLLIPAAEAQASPNLDVSDPQIRAVTASMQQRFGDMKKYFDAGVIGLTSDGQVAIRDQNAIPLAERAVVARLVAEDNRDRATLYTELARANKHPEWEPDIRRTFARRWVERGAQPGWYYQDNGGKWLQK